MTLISLPFWRTALLLIAIFIFSVGCNIQKEILPSPNITPTSSELIPPPIEPSPTAGPVLSATAVPTITAPTIVPTEILTPTLPPPPSEPTPVTNESAETMRHIIVAGEQLAQIAAQYGVSPEAILAANPSINDPNAIFAGGELVIPLGNGATPTNYDANQYTIHIVAEGETLFSIATTYGLNVDDLAAYNSLYNASWIYAGDEIKIPK